MLSRRNFVTATALAAGVSLPAAAPAAAASPRLTATIGGRSYGRIPVLQWEARRLQVAAQRMSRHLPGALVSELEALLVRPALSTTDVARDRRLLAQVKQEWGDARIRRLLAPDLVLSGPAGALTSSLRAWSVSHTVVTSSLGTAEGFARWFRARAAQDEEPAMLVACPDHYVIRSPQPTVQEVIEVTGGAVLASRFFIDYTDVADVPVTRDRACPVQLAGWAIDDSDRRIGAVRHQLRDVPEGGFEAHLNVAFPATLPPWMVAEHRWHLACEFSNWVVAALTAP